MRAAHQILKIAIKPKRLAEWIFKMWGQNINHQTPPHFVALNCAKENLGALRRCSSRYNVWFVSINKIGRGQLLTHKQDLRGRFWVMDLQRVNFYWWHFSFLEILEGKMRTSESNHVCIKELKAAVHVLDSFVTCAPRNACLRAFHPSSIA